MKMLVNKIKISNQQHHSSLEEFRKSAKTNLLTKDKTNKMEDWNGGMKMVQESWQDWRG